MLVADNVAEADPDLSLDNTKSKVTENMGKSAGGI